MIAPGPDPALVEKGLGAIHQETAPVQFLLLAPTSSPHAAPSEAPAKINGSNEPALPPSNFTLFNSRSPINFTHRHSSWISLISSILRHRILRLCLYIYHHPIPIMPAHFSSPAFRTRVSLCLSFFLSPVRFTQLKFQSYFGLFPPWGS